VIIAQGNLLEPVEKVETLEILGVRVFLLQTDSPIETLSLRWDDIDWEMNQMSIPEPKVEHYKGRCGLGLHAVWLDSLPLAVVS
jgi:hypothetical protein